MWSCCSARLICSVTTVGDAREQSGRMMCVLCVLCTRVSAARATQIEAMR